MQTKPALTVKDFVAHLPDGAVVLIIAAGVGSEIAKERIPLTGFLSEGRGYSWLKQNAVITPTNPLMYTCLWCGKTSEGKEPGHEKGCKVKLLLLLGVRDK